MKKKGGDVAAGIVPKSSRMPLSAAFIDSSEQLLISLQNTIRHSRLDIFARSRARAFTERENSGFSKLNLEVK